MRIYPVDSPQAEVDAHVHEGESIVLVAAVEHRGLHHEMFRSPSRN